MLEELIIISRDRPELYERLKREFAGQRNLEVLLDRRWGERRARESRSKQEAAALAAERFVQVLVEE